MKSSQEGGIESTHHAWMLVLNQSGYADVVVDCIITCDDTMRKTGGLQDNSCLLDPEVRTNQAMLMA